MKSYLYILPFVAQVFLNSCSDDVISGNEPGLTGEVDGIAFGIAPGLQSRSEANQDPGPDEEPCHGTFALKDAKGKEVLYLHTHSESLPTPTTDALSRGAATNNVSEIEDFQVNALLQRKQDNGDYDAYWYINNQKFTKSGLVNGSPVYTHDNGQTYYWPDKDANDFMHFIAISPASVVEGTNPPVTGFQADSTFTYTVPADPTQQKDILFARTGALSCQQYAASKQRVPLHFEHLLTQVTFRLGAKIEAGQIRSIKIHGVSRSGQYHSVYHQRWNYSLTDTTTFEINPMLWTTTAQDSTSQSVTITPGTVVNPDEFTLMLMPQTFGPDSWIEVDFFDNQNVDTHTDQVIPGGILRTLASSIEGSRWSKGQHVIYELSIQKLSSLNFPDATPPQDACYVITELPVVTTPGQSWTATIDPAAQCFAHFGQLQPSSFGALGYWIESDCASATTMKNGQEVAVSYTEQITGTGPVNLRVYLEENITDHERYIPITLTGKDSNGNVVTSQTVLRQLPVFKPSGQNFWVQRGVSEDKYIFGYDWQDSLTWDAKNDALTHKIATYNISNKTGSKTTYWAPFFSYAYFARDVLYKWGARGHLYADYAQNGDQLVNVNSSQALANTTSTGYAVTGYLDFEDSHFSVKLRLNTLTGLYEWVNQTIQEAPDATGRMTVTVNGQEQTFPYYTNLPEGSTGFQRIAKKKQYVQVSESDGLYNTQNLYDYLASTRLGVLIDYIQNEIWTNKHNGTWTWNNAFDWTTSPTGISNIDMMTAVRAAIRMNKFRYTKVLWYTGHFDPQMHVNGYVTGDAKAENSPVLLKNMEQRVIGLADNELKWYLPAPGQFAAMAQDYEIYPMIGDYWTSYPLGIGQTADALIGAKYYVGTSNAGSHVQNGLGNRVRNQKKKIRCCRIAE